MHDPSTRGGSITRAIIAIVLTALFFAISDIYAQVLTRSLPPLEVSFLRWAVFVLALPFWHGRLFFRSFVARYPFWQILRGLCGVMSGISFITGLSSLSIGDATGIAFCGPVVTMGLSAWLLKEHVGRRRWLVAGISLAGVMIIAQPGTSAFQWASVLPLMAAVFASLLILITRHVSDEKPEVMLSYAALVGFVVLGALMPRIWVTPAASDVVPILLNGLFGTAANVTMIIAYRNGAASRVAPFNYIQLPFSALFGWLVMGAVPTWIGTLGLILIGVSGVSNAILERRARA